MYRRPSLEDTNDRRASRKGGLPPSSAFAKSAAGMMGLGNSTGNVNAATSTIPNNVKDNTKPSSISHGIGSISGGKVRFGDDADEKKVDDYDFDHHSTGSKRVPNSKRASGIGALALGGGLAGGRPIGSNIGSTPQPKKDGNTNGVSSSTSSMAPSAPQKGGAVSRIGGTNSTHDSLSALMTKPSKDSPLVATAASTMSNNNNKMKESASSKSLSINPTLRTSNAASDRLTPSPQPASNTYQLPSSLLNLSSSSAYSPRTSSSFASAALSSLSPFAPSTSASTSFSVATSPTHSLHYHHVGAAPVVSTRPRPSQSVPTSHVTSPTAARNGHGHVSSLSTAVALPLSLLSPSLLHTLDSPTPGASSPSTTAPGGATSFFPSANGVTSSANNKTTPSTNNALAISPNKKVTGKPKLDSPSVSTTVATVVAAPKKEPVIDQPFARMLVEMSQYVHTLVTVPY
jgi:hypothetical protein